MKNPAEVIFNYIDRTNMTPSELAEICGLSVATIYNILNGTYKPTPLSCSKIARGTNGYIAYEELTDTPLTAKRRRNIKKMGEKRRLHEKQQ